MFDYKFKVAITTHDVLDTYVKIPFNVVRGLILTFLAVRHRSIPILALINFYCESPVSHLLVFEGPNRALMEAAFW